MYKNVINILKNFIDNELENINIYPKKKESFIQATFSSYLDISNKNVPIFEVKINNSKGDEIGGIDVVLLNNCDVFYDCDKGHVESENACSIEIKFAYDNQFYINDDDNVTERYCFFDESKAAICAIDKDIEKLRSFSMNNDIFATIIDKSTIINITGKRESYLLLVIQIRTNLLEIIKNNKPPVFVR